MHFFDRNYLTGRYHESCGLDNARLWRPFPQVSSVAVRNSPTNIDTGIEITIKVDGAVGGAGNGGIPYFSSVNWTPYLEVRPIGHALSN